MLVLKTKKYKKKILLIKTKYNEEGFALQGEKSIRGMKIGIENKKGSYRKGKDKDGKSWKIKMNADYGYIESIGNKEVRGADKEHLDVYCGPNTNSKKIFVIHQQDPETKKYDEDKIMLGFDSKEEAKKLYLSQYNKPGFFQSMKELKIEQFLEKIKSGKYDNKMIKSIMVLKAKK